LWARQRMHAAFWLMIHVFQRPQPVVAPITFPDPTDKFYGYASRRTKRAEGTEVLTTRNLIRVTGWIATARIAYQAGQYVVDKRSCVATFRDVIGDEWTDLLVTVDQRCRQDWRYLIPDNNEEQEQLQVIGRHVLEYENHFLKVYDHFLADELTSNDPFAQSTALEMLGRTWHPEPSILALLHQVADVEHTNGSTAQQLLRRWKEMP
jgi:hypothetical protein